MQIVISTENFVQDSVLLIRAICSSGITDPISATRSGDSQFVLTAYPTRTVQYPHLVINQGNITTRRLGIASESEYATIPFSVRCWARNSREKDSLAQQVVNTLRDRQLGGGSGTIDNGLFGIKGLSAVDIVENIQQGPHSKVIQIQYSCILQN